MEHWFDRLAQPHTRRTTLKAAAVGGAALVLPNMRLSKARATTSEPCYKPCVDAAAKQWADTRNGACKAAIGPGLLGAWWFAFSGQLVGAMAAVIGEFSGLGCFSGAELTWHRAVESCRGSECGDPSKYPGGQAPKPPPPKCSPTEEVVCGDRCCNIVAECCACTADPSGYCCCAAGKCGSAGCT